MDTQALVTIVPSTFVLTILNLFIQIFLMKKFLFQPVKRILEERQNLYVYIILFGLYVFAF